MTTAGKPPRSKHFRLQQLAEGVHAVIHIDGGAAISNAGIIDLGDRTLVYDSLSSPQAAADLRAAAEALTGRAVDGVINGHGHYDHIWGNQAFGAETDIISTDETRRGIIATKGHSSFDALMRDAEANLQSNRAQFQASTDQGQRRQLAFWIDFYQTMADLKSVLQVRAPNMTFSQRLAFHGSHRSAELIDFAGGHVKSDAVLFLPQEGIAFMGDLLFIGWHPYLGDPQSLLQALEAVIALGPEQLVPGHGPVGAADSLPAMQEYVRTMDGLARKIVSDGMPESAIDTLAIPEPYADWLLASFFPTNMHRLYQRYLREQG